MPAARTAFRHPRYRLGRLLGEGGMGKVYLARDLLDDGRQVALKIYPSRFYDTRLRREFLALRELHHPGIASALHFGLSAGDNAPFFTLEYVDGKPLTDHLRGAPGPRGADRPDSKPPLSDRALAQALHLLKKTTTALAYLHRRSILHLDLKPENILVVDRGPARAPRPILIDFGLVRALNASKAPVGHATLPYAPPEMFLSQAPSPASDVYSLAATFYEAFAERPPLVAEDFDGYAEAHRSQSVSPLPQVPKALERILLRALAKDPRKRYRDGGELLLALQTLRLPTGIAVPPDEVVYHEPDFVGRQRELQVATEWLEADRRTRPVLTISGDGGWGKTRFLERLETQLELQSKKSLLLRPESEPGLRNLAAWVRRSAIFEAGDTRRTTEYRKLARGLDDAARRLEENVQSQGVSAQREEEEALLRQWVQRTATHLLPLLCTDTYLLIDDSHLGGRTGDRVVEQLGIALAAQSTPPGGGIVRTRRPDEPADEANSSTVPETRIDLGPLSMREALAIDLEGLDSSLAALPPARARKLKASLHESVGGHPLFYVQGLLDLAGAPRSTASRVATDHVTAHLERLQDDERRVATYLACLDRPTPIPQLSELLEVPESAVATLVERLRLAGLVARVHRSVRLIHEAVKDAIVRASTAPDLEEAQQSLARRLEALAEREGSSRLFMEAAFHALCAENAQEAARLCKRWLESGGATDAPSSVRSITVLRRVARELGEKTREGARLLEAVAHVLEGHGRYEESLKLLTALSASGPPQEVALKRRLGSLAWRVGKTRLALRHLGACVGAEVEAADPVEAVHARSELALLRHFRGDTDEALEHAAHGIALWKKLRAAKRESTLSSVVKLHGILGQVCIRRLQFNEAIDALQAGLKVASGKTAPANVCLLLNNLALAQHLGGDLSAALETFSLAEGQARELADPAALASVRANVAQLHAKQGQFHLARDLLDTLENAPAVRQSSRLRLGSLYSQGLYLNLLRGEADSVWTEVEDLAATVGDAFLGRFAGLQRAEGYIFSGRYAAARGILEAAIPKEGRRKGKQELLESLHDSLVHSRLATVAALCGDRETSRSARDRVASTMSDGREVPAMLHSWSLVYGGIAAVETGDWIEAHSMLTEALDTFVRTGFLAGQVECHLALADGLLRQSTGDPNHPDEHVLTKVKESIRHAKEAPFEAPTGVSPRDRDLRVALLDARYALHDLLRRIDGNGPLEQTEEVQQSLADSLVRVAGDPALTHTAEYTLQLELLLSVSATLRGDRQAARDAEARARAAQRQLARSLCASARKAFGKRDPWQRYGLTAFRPGSGAQRLGRASTEALEHVLSAVARGPAGSFNSLLGLLAARLGVELRMWGETLEQPLTGGELPKGTARCTLVTFISTQGRLTGGLRASRDATLPFTAEEEVLINLAGKALAPWVTRGAATTPARPDAERSTEELSAHRKREKPRGSARTETRKVGVSSRFVQRVLEEEGIVAAGREMQRVITLARKLAMADLPILITGESGTGKDVVARLIHLLSPRADAPFLSQSASAVPEELFEADLFGYEQGAFTGAEQTRTGFLFRASGGTFHLEEIGDLAPGMQQRFLRVLEENVVRPLGATSARQLDVHFIASTHQDIEAMLEAGSFRRDLFFRLSGARISLPPLRRRLDEIPALAEHYWAEFAKSRSRFPTSTREALCSHTWPGNVRELITVLRRLSLEVSGVPSAGDVRAVLGEATTQGPFCPGLFESSSYAELKQSLEESYLEHLWTKHAGDLERIATDLGTTSRSVYRRFERLGLKPKDLAQRGRK